MRIDWRNVWRLHPFEEANDRFLSTGIEASAGVIWLAWGLTLFLYLWVGLLAMSHSRLTIYAGLAALALNGLTSGISWRWGFRGNAANKVFVGALLAVASAFVWLASAA